MYFVEKLLFFGTFFRQTKCAVMMNKEGSSKIVNIMTPGAGVPVQWSWPYKSYSKNASIISLKIFSIHRHRSEKLRI